jgi:hypothetical protein
MNSFKFSLQVRQPSIYEDKRPHQHFTHPPSKTHLVQDIDFLLELSVLEEWMGLEFRPKTLDRADNILASQLLIPSANESWKDTNGNIFKLDRIQY